MAKDHYLPKADKEKQVWLSNFSAKFGAIAISLGFTAAEVTALANDVAMFIYLLAMVEAFTTGKEQRVNYKNLIKNGPIGTPGGALPVAPVLGVAPALVAPGIFPRVQALVQRIKVATNYTEAIGKDLGIIGADQSADSTLLKPTLKLVMKGGQVEVQWIKGNTDGVRIEVDRGTGTWQFLAIDSVPHYTDSAPITAPATWKYRAMYIDSDELVGQWSDVASIAVG